MRRFALEVIIFTVISMLCFSVFGQSWQDEEHVWSEEKGRFEVHNRAQGRANDVPEMGERIRVRPYDDVPWGKYLSRNVRYGKREPSAWEISEAQRKLWAKEILTVRAMQKAEQRRQLIAHRKASGWYGARRSGSHAYGNWMLQAHIQSVNNYMRGGYRGY